jgi:sucrose phosphorylase
MNAALLAHLTFLYGEKTGKAAHEKLVQIVEAYRPKIPAPESAGLNERDVLLITYGDQVSMRGQPPLQSLTNFCRKYLRGVVSGIHILPFYPSSSDDGFSVIDYRQVDPTLGAWEDIQALGKDFRLMFDAVINHISAQSKWFQGFRLGKPEYLDDFIVIENQPDLSRVVRPRTLPLLTEFDTPAGKKKVWTTFSADQIDLNYHNPQVLLEMLETLLFYAEQGAHFIRLDAIAYLWKEVGSACIHLPQTHRIVQLIRSVLDDVAPHVQIITETNVPHAENIAYFGDGSNEAQMVYNFALPPLMLHTFHTGDARAITRWASGLDLPSDKVAFFNFLASHDGIGVTPAKGLISDAEIQAVVDRALAHGGLVSYRSDPDGSQSPYELNINYFDALSDPFGGEPRQLQVDRFVAAHALLFSLSGVPAIYFHSLFGSRSWREGVALTGRNRTINRQKLDGIELEAELADVGSLRSTVFRCLAHLLVSRAAYPAFHPQGGQQVLELEGAVFAVLRTSPDGRYQVLCLYNVCSQPVSVTIDLEGLFFGFHEMLVDLVSQARFVIKHPFSIVLEAYQVIWLHPVRKPAQGGNDQ